MATLVTMGDSVTFGLNSSSHPNSWSALLATYLGATESDLAVSSTQIIDQCSDSRSSTRNQWYASGSAPSTTNYSAALVGYNDMRFFGLNANGLETFNRTLRSAIAWRSRVAGDCYQASNGAWTFTGSWTALTINGLDTKYSSTNGNTASISFTGTACTLSYISRFGFADGGTFSVKIDGVTVNASVDSNFGSASGFNPGSGLTQYVPMALRFDGLASGSHTLLVTLTSAAITQIAFATGNGETSKPEIRLCGPLKMDATGYTVSGAYVNGSDAAVALYAGVITSLCLDAAVDGRVVKYADVNNYYSIANVDTDHIHPTDAGHAQIATAFEAAIISGSFARYYYSQHIARAA